MLTTIEDIKAIRSIAYNITDKRIEPYIKEVEDCYVMYAIGPALYERLDTGLEEDIILTDGGYYDHGNTREMCYGIKAAVAYFAYERMLLNNQINVTAFGVTQKSSSLSTPTPDSSIEKAAAHAHKMGELYLESCKKYVHRGECIPCGTNHRPFISMEVIK